MTDYDLEVLDDHLGRRGMRTCPCGNVPSHPAQSHHVQLQDAMVVRTCSVCFYVQLFAWAPLKAAVESYRRSLFAEGREGY